MSGIYDNEDFFKAYADMERSKKGLEAAGEWHQLKPLFPDLKNKTVLDLGCGYGWHCKYAADNGAASVLGIDLSEKMIAEALKRNSHPSIQYSLCGINEYDYPAEKFDLVVSNLALHYIKDIDEVYRKVFTTLKHRGIFLFNIEHPVFTAGINQSWIYDEKGNALYCPIDNYYYPGERKTMFLDQTVVKQHHTLTQILMGLISTRFKIEAVEEAMPPKEMMNIPGMKDEMRRPMMLLVKASKQ